MSDISQGPDWWLATDGKWYPPKAHPQYVPVAPPITGWEQTNALPTEPPAPNVGDTPPVAPPAWDGAAGGSLTAGPAWDHGTAPTPPPASGSGKRTLGVVAVLAVLLVGGGALAWSFLRGDSTGGGADSPEQAVRDMVASVDDGDVLGMLSSMDPTEVGSIIATYDNLTEAARDGAGMEVSDSGLFGDVDIAMSAVGGGELELEATPDRQDDQVVRVAMDSLVMTITRTDTAPQAVAVVTDDETYAFSTAEFSPGTFASLEFEARGRRTDVTLVVDGVRSEPVEAPFELEMLVIQRNGKWFVSPGATIAELVIEGVDGDPLDWGLWQEELEEGNGGGESPADAAESLVQAVVDFEVEDGVRSLDPDVDRLVYAIYGSVERDIDQQGLREENRAARPDLTRFDVEEIDVDGQSRVAISELEVEFDDRGDQLRLATDGWCISVSDDFDFAEICLDEALEGVTELPDRPFLVTNERNGRHYVSLLETGAAWTEAVVGNVIVDGSAEGLSTSEIRGIEATPVVTGGTVTVTSTDETSVVAVSVPVTGSYDLSSDFDTDQEACFEADDRVDRVRCDVERSDFVLVTATASEPVNLAIGSGRHDGGTGTTELTGVVGIRRQLDRTVPVTIFGGTPGVEVTVRVEPIVPQLLTAAGGYTLTPIPGSDVAVVVVVGGFDGTIVTVDGGEMTFDRQVRDLLAIDVNGDSFSGGTEQELFGHGWFVVRIDGESADLTVSDPFDDAIGQLRSDLEDAGFTDAETQCTLDGLVESLSASDLQSLVDNETLSEDGEAVVDEVIAACL